jgi:hypothetical protein
MFFDAFWLFWFIVCFQCCGNLAPHHRAHLTPWRPEFLLAIDGIIGVDNWWSCSNMLKHAQPWNSL